MVKADCWPGTGQSDKSLVLASASASRANLLCAAGISFEQKPSRVDEDALKEAMRAEGADAGDTALALAELKARRISTQSPEAYVIGADQLLDCGGVWFDKPKDRADAAAHLHALSGKKHELATAVCVMREGATLWTHIAKPALHMRALSDEAITGYLDAAGDRILSSVGAYQLEGLGVNLFSRIEGDWFSILGLPMLPLTAFLRDTKVLSP